MLTLKLPEKEITVQKGTEVEVLFVPGQEIRLEHSLISLSKWEETHKKPFLREKNKTDDELLDYFRCMCITPNIDEKVFKTLSKREQKQIIDYINDPMTATTFGDANDKNKNRPKRGGQVFTSELIYYYMIAYNIPVQFEKWHLNRLLTLIRVCEVKNEEQSGGKKMSKRELLNQNAALNAQRRAKHNSKG